MSFKRISRRVCVLSLLGSASALFAQDKSQDPAPADWVCPMDPDVRSVAPGVCPRCGMRLVLHIPERIEYTLELTHSPALLRPNAPATLQFRVINPDTNQLVHRFELVHEKLMHLFLVSQNLEYFAHLHPVIDDDVFRLAVRLPLPGMYRVLADYYPADSVPQLSVNTFFVSGPSQPAHLTLSRQPCRAENLTATLETDPARLIAGLESKLIFSLDPADGLEPYLGAWGHMLAASEDLIDLLHVHPFLANGNSRAQFNVIFPRPGMYRIWTQFQRKSQVNTVVFTLPVSSL